MAERNIAALEFLQSRRSRPAKTLKAPAPDRQELRALLTAAARSPDHGKLEPWRFIVMERKRLVRISELARRRGERVGMDPDKLNKAASAFGDANLVVAVVGSPRKSETIPVREQVLSAGAVCLSLLNAALAAGWGANWLTGFTAYDDEFCSEVYGLEAEEFIAGFIHLGTESSAPPERPRPNIDAITTWLEN